MGVVRRAKSPVFRDKFKGGYIFYELLFYKRCAVLIVLLDDLLSLSQVDHHQLLDALPCPG